MDNVFVIAYPKIYLMCYTTIAEVSKLVMSIIVVTSCTSCVVSQVTSISIFHFITFYSKNLLISII